MQRLFSFFRIFHQLLSSAVFMKDTRSQFILALFFTSYIIDFHLQAIIQLSAWIIVFCSYYLKLVQNWFSLAFLYIAYDLHILFIFISCSWPKQSMFAALWVNTAVSFTLRSTGHSAFI